MGSQDSWYAILVSVPAVVAPPPVYVRPVCYRPVPVCAPPVVSVSFGFGPRFGLYRVERTGDTSQAHRFVMRFCKP